MRSIYLGHSTLGQASIAQLSTSRRCRAELVPRSRCRTAAAEPLVPQGFADAFATATAAPLPPPQHLSVLAVGAPWESVAGSQFPRMERQMDAMQRAMEKDMDTFFDFSSVRRFEREMDQEMRAMDEQMGALQRRLDEDLARSMRELQQAPPGVRIERSEQRSPGSYRYYESISIHSGPMATLVPAHATAPSLFNPLLLAALVLTGAWAAVTAAFSRNYDLTVYSPRSRWQLLLLWPVLLANKRFRHQFTAALRGESAKATQDGAVGPPSSGSSS